MVLGGRHLLGIFALLVVILGVVFTLGYLLGRSQYDTQLHAVADAAPARPEKPAKLAEKPAAAADHKPAGDEAAPPPPDWDFYHSGQPEQAPERLAPQAKPVTTKSPSAATPATQPPAVPRGIAARATPPRSGTPKPDESLNAPLIPRGATVLQVAALVREADALALAQALQQKKFPAFVLTPGADHFYRVQVGPYGDAQSASIARHQLEGQGFKTIIKR